MIALTKPSILCLATLQPTAWALFHGKKSDVRGYSTDHRGNLLIYATKPNNYQLKILTKELAAINLTPPEFKTLPQKAIIGSVNLVGIFPYENTFIWHFQDCQIWEQPIFISLQNPKLLFSIPLDLLRSHGHDFS